MVALMKSFLMGDFSGIMDSTVSHAYFHLFAAMAQLLVVYLYHVKPKCVYLVDFSCYLPRDSSQVSISNFIEHSETYDVLDREAIDFRAKVAVRSGIGSEACVPVTAHQIPPDASLNPSREEIETVLFTVVEDLLSKHKINPKSIDIVVSNCSIFCPTPSITAMVVNKFGFRSNVKSFSLSGMECSAGLLAISLAKDLRKVHGNSLALVLRMEAVTPNGYGGNVKSMLLANVLFRMGGLAILLSNKKSDKKKAKYKLRHLIRTHWGSDDNSYWSVFQESDESGNVGVSLSRSLLHVAGNALKTNVSELGPLVLPYSEQFLYGWSVFCNLIWRVGAKKEIYMPNFRKAFEHFCIHAGGRAVIGAIEEKLKPNKEDGEASTMTQYRFGNTSSSSVWYELCYLEAKGRARKGDQIWQISFGSGFKCNSAVWECISELDPNVRNTWSGRIHLYPVEIPKIADH